MPTLNPDSVYQLPSREIQKSGVGINDEELAALITAVQPHLDEALRADFAVKMQAHVGEPSTYTLKKEVREGLKVIHQHFFKPNISSSEQSAIAYKLAERAEHCTPGFHNGVNAIVDGFYLPENTDELLYRYRRELVATAASQLSDEVHAHNRCFTIAATSGFGVFPLNSGDVYRGAVSDEAIQAKLTSLFDDKMRLFPMVQGLQAQLLSLLLSSGYHGLSTVFSSEVIEKIDPVLMTLFAHHPVVESLKAAQAAHKAQTDAYTQAHHKAFENLKAFVKNNPSEFAGFDTFQRPKLDYLFTGKAVLPKFKEWGDECLAKLSQDDKVAFEELKIISASIDPSIEKAWNIATEKFNQCFYSQDSEGRILDVHWKNIRQLLWHDINEKHYFVFESTEQLALEKLFNQDLSETQFKQSCVQVFKTLGHLDDFISMFELLPEMKQLLHIDEVNEYFSKNPMTYEQFKKTFTTLGDGDLGKSFVRQYYQRFLGELEQDPFMPIPLFGLMTPEVIKGFFSKQHNEKTMAHLLAGLAGCNQDVKTQALKQTDPNGDNALMWAARSKPEALEPLLKILSTCSDDVKEQVLLHTDIDGNTAFMCAVKYNQGALAPFLADLSTCPDDVKAQVLLHPDRDGWNALMWAVRHKPGEIAPLLASLSTCSDDVKRQVLLHTDRDGWNALMCALLYKPEALAPLLASLSTCTDDMKIQVLTQTNKDGYNALMLAVLYKPGSIAPLLASLSTYTDDVKIQALTQTNKNGYNALIFSATYNPEALAPLLKTLSTCPEDLIAQVLTYNTRDEVGKSSPLALIEFDLNRMVTTTKSPLWKVVASTFEEYKRTGDHSLLTSVYKTARTLLNDRHLNSLFPSQGPKSIAERFKTLIQRQQQPSRYETMVQNVIDTLCHLKPGLKNIDLSSTDITPKLK